MLASEKYEVRKSQALLKFLVPLSFQFFSALTPYSVNVGLKIAVCGTYCAEAASIIEKVKVKVFALGVSFALCSVNLTSTIFSFVARI